MRTGMEAQTCLAEQAAALNARPATRQDAAVGPDPSCHPLQPQPLALWWFHQAEMLLSFDAALSVSERFQHP